MLAVTAEVKLLAAKLLLQSWLKLAVFTKQYK